MQAGITKRVHALRQLAEQFVPIKTCSTFTVHCRCCCIFHLFFCHRTAGESFAQRHPEGSFYPAPKLSPTQTWRKRFHHQLNVFVASSDGRYTFKGQFRTRSKRLKFFSVVYLPVNDFSWLYNMSCVRILNLTASLYVFVFIYLFIWSSGPKTLIVKILFILMLKEEQDMMTMTVQCMSK